MNEYEKAFEIILNGNPYYNKLSPFGLMKKLVERATPKKSLSIKKITDTPFYIGNCPVCLIPVTSESKFCPKDGQALDWSESNG